MILSSAFPVGEGIGPLRPGEGFSYPTLPGGKRGQQGRIAEYTKKSLGNPLNQSKVHKKSAAKKKFLGKVEKILKIFDFLIDFREKLSYNRGCMERETGP